MDMIFSEVDGSLSVKGACKEGTPSVDDRDEEKHNNRTNFRKRDMS